MDHLSSKRTRAGARPLYGLSGERGDVGGRAAYRRRNVKRTGRLRLQSTLLPVETRLAADTEAGNKRLVALRSRVLQIVQQPTPLGNHRQQPTTGVMVLRVRLEVILELKNTLAKDG